MFARILIALILVFSPILFADDATEPQKEGAWMRLLRKELGNKELLLKFADWLEAEGQKARADFIRMVQEPRDSILDSEPLFKLLHRSQREIAPGLPKRYYHKEWAKSPIDFFRANGLIVVSLSPDRIDDLKDLLGKNSSPVVGLRLEGKKWFKNKALKTLFKRPELERVAYLQIYSTNIEYLDAFLESPYLKNLRHLIFENPSGVLNPAGCGKLARGIAENPTFSGLTHLYFPIWDPGNDLIQVFKASPNLARVANTPLIYPPSTGWSIDPIRPARPHIPQNQWNRRPGRRACGSKVIEGL